MTKSKEILSNKRNIRFYKKYSFYECGLVLNQETKKKIMNYQVSLNGSYGWIMKNEIWLKGLTNEPIKLLLNKYEIEKIIQETKTKKYLLIPENLYLKNHKLKISLTLSKRESKTSKKKLESIKRKDEKKIDKYINY